VKFFLQSANKSKEDDAMPDLPIVYEDVNDRWQVAVSISHEGSFKQVLFFFSYWAHELLISFRRTGS